MGVWNPAAGYGALLFDGISIDCLAQSASGQAAGGRVIGTGALTSFVEDMARSLAFYHDAFGMEVPPLPDSAMRPYNASNSQLFAMFDIHGAKERHQSARFPDSQLRLEFMEIQNVGGRLIPMRIQDPGAMTLVFIVDAVLERSVGAGA